MSQPRVRHEFLVKAIEIKKEEENCAFDYFGTLRIRWCTLSCGKKDREENTFSSLNKHSKREKNENSKTTRWSFFHLVCRPEENSERIHAHSRLGRLQTQKEWLLVECGKPHDVLTLLSAVGSPNNTSSQFFFQPPAWWLTMVLTDRYSLPKRLELPKLSINSFAAVDVVCRKTFVIFCWSWSVSEVSQVGYNSNWKTFLILLIHLNETCKQLVISFHTSSQSMKWKVCTSSVFGDIVSITMICCCRWSKTASFRSRKRHHRRLRWLSFTFCAYSLRTEMIQSDHKRIYFCFSFSLPRYRWHFMKRKSASK